MSAARGWRDERQGFQAPAGESAEIPRRMGSGVRQEGKEKEMRIYCVTDAAKWCWTTSVREIQARLPHHEFFTTHRPRVSEASKFDLIWQRGYAPIFPGAERAGIPVVWTFTTGGAMGEFHLARCRSALANGSTVICQSAASERLLRAAGARHVAMIPNGVDTCRFRPTSAPPSDFVVGMAANINGERWIYSDTRKSDDGQRACRRCGRKPTAEGYDACLGHVDGVTSACCGHGVEPPYSTPNPAVTIARTGKEENMSSEQKPQSDHQPSGVASNALLDAVLMSNNKWRCEMWALRLHKSTPPEVSRLVETIMDRQLELEEEAKASNPTGQPPPRLGGGSVAPGCSTLNSGGEK